MVGWWWWWGGADRAGLPRVSRYAETQSPSDAAAEEHQAAQGQPRTDHMTAGTGGTLTPPTALWW